MAPAYGKEDSDRLEMRGVTLLDSTGYSTAITHLGYVPIAGPVSVLSPTSGFLQAMMLCAAHR